MNNLVKLSALEKIQMHRNSEISRIKKIVELSGLTGGIDLAVYEHMLDNQIPRFGGLVEFEQAFINLYDQVIDPENPTTLDEYTDYIKTLINASQTATGNL